MAQTFTRPVFFSGKLVFARENLLTRLLHNHAAQTLQRRLQFEGLQMVILPGQQKNTTSSNNSAKFISKLK